MKLLNIFISLLSLQINLPALAQESKGKTVSNPSLLIEQVNNFSLNTTSITCEFTQQKEMNFMEEKVISNGKFYFQHDNMLRWEYISPFNYTIILNNNRIRIIDEGVSKNYDAGSNRMFLEITEIMSSLVSGTLLKNDKFGQSWFETADHYIVELIPFETLMKDYLAKIELKLSRSDFSVDELKMYEKSGDYTLITFRNKKLNDAIPPDMFRVD